MIQPNPSKRSCGPPQAMPDDTWDPATIAAFLDLLARLLARQHLRTVGSTSQIQIPSGTQPIVPALPLGTSQNGAVNSITTILHKKGI